MDVTRNGIYQYIYISIYIYSEGSNSLSAFYGNVPLASKISLAKPTPFSACPTPVPHADCLEHENMSHNSEL